jgi:hypothetical protein
MVWRGGDLDKAWLQTITPAQIPLLPERRVFLSGLASELSPWSVGDVADIMIRSLPVGKARSEIISMKDVGSARELFAVARRFQPSWNVSYEDAAAVVSKHIESMVREGHNKAAMGFWVSRMGGRLGSERVWMVGANLRGANLPRRDLQYYIFDNANLEGANLSGARISQAAGANLSRIRGDNLNAESANLSGARFNGAELDGAKFTRALVTGVDFSDANLANAKLNVKMPIGDISPFEGTRMDRANLEQARFEHNNERSAPWWTDRNPVFIGTPMGYNRIKLLVGSGLAKASPIPF